MVHNIEAWSWFYSRSYHIHWHFWGMEIRSAVALGSLISRTDNPDVAEVSIHGSPVCTLVSHYSVFNIGEFSPHMVLTSCWNLRHVHHMMNFDKSWTAECQYILSSSLGPCCRWAKVWVAWMSKGIVEYCLKSSFLRSSHVRCGRWVS